jgi:CheY-like chemotaxis protein
MFDLPSMLGEYLLPLLILVPLAVVLVLLATRNQKDEPWQQRRDAQAPWTPPPARPVLPPPAPVAGQLLPETQAPLAPPADFVPTSPFLDDTLTDTRPVAEPVPVAPLATPQRRRASDVLPGPAAPAGGPVPLLVVDDSAVVRAKLSKLLSGAGYAVTLARHGHEALEQINQHWFAMMITDLEMPEMDGFELIAHVSNDIRTENLPIVAITGHEALQAKVQDAKGLYGIFKKPWNDRELLARVGVLTQLRPRA